MQHSCVVTTAYKKCDWFYVAIHYYKRITRVESPFASIFNSMVRPSNVETDVKVHHIHIIYIYKINLNRKLDIYKSFTLSDHQRDIFISCSWRGFFRGFFLVLWMLVDIRWVNIYIYIYNLLITQPNLTRD